MNGKDEQYKLRRDIHVISLCNKETKLKIEGQNRHFTVNEQFFFCITTYFLIII